MPVVRGKDIEVLFSASTIARRNLELAKEIAAHEYHDLLVISVLPLNRRCGVACAIAGGIARGIDSTGSLPA